MTEVIKRYLSCSYKINISIYLYSVWINGIYFCSYTKQNFFKKRTSKYHIIYWGKELVLFGISINMLYIFAWGHQHQNQDEQWGKKYDYSNIPKITPNTVTDTTTRLSNKSSSVKTSFGMRISIGWTKCSGNFTEIHIIVYWYIH